MATDIVAQRGDTPAPLPALWRVERTLHVLADNLGQRHRAIADLLAAYGAPEGAILQLEVMLGDDRAALRFAADELRRIRHQLSRVLP
jgi:hypothetical protein